MLGLQSPSISTREERIAPQARGSFPQVLHSIQGQDSRRRNGRRTRPGKSFLPLTAPRLAIERALLIQAAAPRPLGRTRILNAQQPYLMLGSAFDVWGCVVA